MRLTHSLLAVALAFISTSFACKVPNPEFDGSETGETGTLPGEEGQWWCAQFPQPPGALAFYEEEDPPDDEQPITTFQGTGDPPSACRCAHPDLDDFLEEELEMGLLYIDASLINDWDAENIDGEGPLHFRDALFAEVSDDCEHLADTYHLARDEDNCQSAFGQVDHEEVPLTRDNDTCIAWITYGDEENMVPLPGDGWDDYFTLASVITYNSGLDLYTIDGAFFNSMLQTPEWIIDDDVYVDFNGTDYQFYNVASGTIAHALGIQSGDVPQTLNSIDISTMDGVMEAWTTLQEETEFELVVRRGMNTVTLDYLVTFVL